MNIPDDVMETARKVHLDILGWGIEKTVGAIARAILSERESATKAERERCAGIADVRGRDCDGRYNESDDRYDMGGAASAEDIAASIRKGVGK